MLDPDEQVPAGLGPAHGGVAPPPWALFLSEGRAVYVPLAAAESSWESARALLRNEDFFARDVAWGSSAAFGGSQWRLVDLRGGKGLAGLPAGAKVGGEFGFLRGTAEAIEDGVGLRGALVADVTRDGVETPRFAALTANADLRLTAQFATGGADAGLALPRIRTDFHLDWSLSGDPAAG